MAAEDDQGDPAPPEQAWAPPSATPWAPPEQAWAPPSATPSAPPEQAWAPPSATPSAPPEQAWAPPSATPSAPSEQPWAPPAPSAPVWGGPPPPPWGPPPGDGWYWGPPPEPRVPTWKTPLPVPEVPPRWGMGDIVIGLALWIAASLVVARGVNAAIGNRSAAIIAGQLAGMAALVGWPLVAARRKGSGTLRDDFGFRVRLPLDLGLGLALALVVIFASGLLRAVLVALTGGKAITNATTIFGDQSTSAGLAAMVVLASLGAPVAEELFFRGLALRAIEKRWGSAAGIVGSTVVFAALHALGLPASPVEAAILVGGIAVYGAAFGVVTWLTGRLGPSIVAHMAINTLATAVYLSGVTGAR